MDSVSLSLEEIIAKTKGSKRGRGGDSSFKSDSVHRPSGVRQRGGGSGGFRTGGSTTKSVPSGKWKHDKFSSSEARGGGGASSRGSASVGGHASSAANLHRKVRVNVSNLASTVTTSDLEELFAPFNPDSAVCHYGEGGEHLGTGDVVLKKADAQKALTNFVGVSVDGSRLHLSIVEGGTGSIYDRIDAPIKRVSGGGITKRSRDVPVGRGQQARRQQSNRSKAEGGRHPLDPFDGETPKGGRGGSGGKKGGKKQPLTEADLDAELDAYMKKP